jgi:AcrR family transcriptional regulator
MRDTLAAQEGATSAPTARFHEKREAVLNAAAALFNERGVKGTTLSDIAASVGLATNSVTYYYRKKEDLACECFLRSIAAMDAIVVQAAKAETVAARVQRFFMLYAQAEAAVDSQQQPALAYFNDIRALPSPQSDDVFAAYSEMFRRIRSLLKGPPTAQLAREDLNARGHIVLSVALAMRMWFTRHEPAQYTRVAARVADVLLFGMQATHSSWPAQAQMHAWPLGASAEGPMDAFLRAATFLVNEQGYRGASVDKISARLNVTKGSFYHHNDNKQDLIAACFDRSFKVLREALGHAESSPGTGWQRVCAAACALLRYQLSESGPLLRSSATSALPDEVQRKGVRRTMNQLTERLGGVIVEGLMDGSVRPLDPAIAAQCAIGAINAAAELHHWLPGVQTGRVIELYLRPVFEGVLCPPASSSVNA